MQLGILVALFAEEGMVGIWTSFGVSASFIHIFVEHNAGWVDTGFVDILESWFG